MKIKRLQRPFNLKSVEDDGTFVGYASVFGVEDWYGDIVEPGAFEDSIAKHKASGFFPPILWQHNPKQPIGKHTKIEEDEHGLLIHGKLLIDTVAQAKEAYSLLVEKVIRGISIGYEAQEWTYEKENDIFRLTKIDLWENSIVTFPANVEAMVTEVKSIRDVERLLRDVGISRKEAKRIASGGYEYQRDAEEDETEIKEMLQELTRITRG